MERRPPSPNHFSAHGIAVLVATRNRDALLCSRSIPSIARQTLSPDHLIVVNDGEPLERATTFAIEGVPVRATTSVLLNVQARGVAGAWNTGLAHLSSIGHTGYVALLDDDDEWDPEHLGANWSAASAADADGCVSGLRMCFAGQVVPRPLISELRETDFLVGNPGWQGSNTFVHMRAFDAIGGFRPGLSSCNDRDLAIRLLRLPRRRWILVPRWTATWHQEQHPTLSSRGSPAKLDGLRQFWSLYGGGMSASEQEAFFERARTRFGFERDTVLHT
jgi:glycosyltransferase involved in cell wall biosynthesis